jgi:uncharacterized protein YjbI with pentapeptide repeats
MKLTLLGVDVAKTTFCSADWFSSLLLSASLIIISPSTAAPQTSAEVMSPVEEWVVAQLRVGETADLIRQFPDEEKDKRKLSAHFLEDLLTGALPGFKPHRNGIRIVGAIIDDPIDLTNAQIPSEVRLEHCQFTSGANFTRASFAGLVSFDGSVFNAHVTFHHVKIGDSIFVRKTVFKGQTDFESADISGNLAAAGAAFQNKENPAEFTRLKVGGDANFNFAEFNTRAYYVSADIADNFTAEEAKFYNAVRFDEMKVRGDAQFPKAEFDEGVDFESADITGNFGVPGAKFHSKKEPALFRLMKVGGYAVFNDAAFYGPVDFRYAEFAWLDLSDALLPNVPSQFQMQGMTYQYISAARDEAESHKMLLKLVNQSAYSADVFSRLEDFFLREGYSRHADEAFIAGKLRVRERYTPSGRSVGEYFLSGDWLRWLGSTMLYLLVGYGRRAWQAAIPCAALIALGCILFSPNKMEAQNPEETPRVYSRFWYSVGLFLPFVDLQANKGWKPKADQTFLRNYMQVHTLLGWVLIPIVLAALTGLIK